MVDGQKKKVQIYSIGVEETPDKILTKDSPRVSFAFKKSMRQFT